MKNKIKVLGFIALAAIIGFSMTVSLAGCDDGSGGGKTLVSIAVTTQPTKTLYNIGDTIDLSGLVVTATYSDGSTVTVSISAENVSGFDSSTAGSKTITVSYKGKKAFFTVTVSDGSGAADLAGNITISPSTGVNINMELTATYSGSETVSFQWKKDGINVGTATTTNPNKYTPTVAGSYTVTVSAAGYNPKTSAVIDVNDPSLPTLKGTITISPSTAAVNTELTAAYSGSETVSFQWKKDGSNIGTATTTNPNKYTPTTAGSYTVTVSLAGYNNKTSAAVSVTSGSQGTAPTITTTSLPDGEVGTAYSQTLTATGATITWSVDSGTLPSGLELSAEGVISGTPTTAGTSTFTVKATDAGGSDTKQLSIIVIKIPTYTSITEFATWLAEQPANTAATSYRVKLNVSDLGGNSATAGSVGKTLKDNNTKYVSLDLSGSTFTSLPCVSDTGAFDGCTSLTSVTIGNSVTTIEHFAFYGCTNLTVIIVASDNAAYTSQDGVLYNKAKTTLIQYPVGKTDSTFTIPDGVTSIDWGAFGVCASLTSVTIGNSVTTIGRSAFSGCTSLTSVTIPDSVTSIGFRAFYNCKSLASVTIGNSVTTIGEYAFLDCTSLTSVTIPNSVTSIGDWAFSYCRSLASVTIGNSVTSIGDTAFLGCTSLASVTVDINNPNYSSQDGIVYNKAKTQFILIPIGITGNVTIPDSVTSIEGWAFSNCTSLASVTIGNSVISIGQQAFDGCTSLASVTIGNSVTSIGDYAFENCTSLTSVTIPDSVISIESRAFYGCTSLTSVTVDINNPNYSSQDGILYNKAKTQFILIPSKITGNVTIPDSITIIAYYAFSGCTSLTSVTIPDSVISIRDSAFSGCTSLASVTIGNSVTGIGNYAFSGCTSLTDITIPNSVTGIGNYAFSGCTSLTDITIPNSVTWIGTKAFDYCLNLTSVTFAEGSNIPDADFENNAFPEGNWGNGGNSLKSAYSTGKAGTYTREENGDTWTKQP